jgi:hypothetical protein
VIESHDRAQANLLTCFHCRRDSGQHVPNIGPAPHQPVSSKSLLVRYYLERVPLSEADTRAKLIDPAIHQCGWSEDMICRETTLGAVEIIAGKARRRSGGRSDYTLRIRVNAESQPVAVALIEAKKDTLPPGHGLAREAEGSWLRIRPIDRLESTRVERSEGASSPFFSPDGRWIGFFAKGRLFKVSTSGGAPTVLCEAGSECRGASWSTRDAIVFTPTPASNLSVVPADGGAPRPATTLDFAQGERDASLAGRAAQRAQRALHHRPSRFRVVRRG